MKKLSFLLAITMTIFMTSCNDDDPNEANEFVTFGRYYGFCQGEDCIQYFRVTKRKVFEYPDNCLPIPVSSCYETNPTELSDAKADIAESLIDNFPDALFDESESTLGCPDCVDQGGLFIEILKNGDRRAWDIDQTKGNLPTYLHDYVDEINSVIDQM
jgi:hypothetical protein